MANEENVSEEPKLRFEYLNKYLEGEVQECEVGEKYSLGRGDTNDIVIDLEYVSKKHLLLYYDEEMGWVFENLSLNSSTWIHPKQYSQIFVGAKQNSPPTPLRSGSVVKARSFNFKFT